MSRASTVLTLALGAFLAAGAGTSQASEASDALADCLYKNTSQADRNAFVQWAFVTIGKADAAKAVTEIPQAKIRQVEKKRSDGSHPHRSEELLQARDECPHDGPEEGT